MPRLRLDGSDGWELSSARRLRAAPDPFVARLLEAGPWLRAGETLDARPRRGAAPVVDLSWTAPAGESAVLLVRHASGAIVLVPPRAEEVVRRGSGTGRLLRFQVAVPAPPAGRRGLASAFRVAVLRVLGGLVDRSLPRLALNFETVRWERRGRVPGLVKVTAEGLREGRLPPADPAELPPPPARSLLLVHGILSDAESAFASLARVRTAAGRPLIAELSALYQGRLYAFNHFTVGKGPAENAAELLAALPPRQTLFDAVTHSRGGVVLRALAAQRAARRLRIGRAVLVASPNRGSALASPEAWDRLVSWIANLSELFPGGALAHGVDFVAEAIRWLAHRAAGALPGVAALSPGSAFLQQLGPPPGDEPSALAANFVPQGDLLRRLMDAGLGSLFQGAHDLVVPTEGGWRGEEGEAIAPERIGCFGPGGNLPAAVHHVTFFERRETAEFLWNALRGEPQGLPALDLSAALPRKRGARRGGTRQASRKSPAPPAWSAAEAPGGSAFQLVLLGTGPKAPARLLATYGNARVVEEVGTRGGEAGQRMRQLIALHERLLAFLRGKPGSLPPPKGDELLSYGAVLFETLFPGDVRRLYDTARATRGAPLDVVFTSGLPWLADKPWELAYDRVRGAFLATEETHLVRGVLSAVPTDSVARRDGPLELLVASAQPAAAEPLSIAQEVDSIQAAFAPLVAEKKVRLDVLPHATPELLHQRVAATRPDALHLIAHGEYDEDAETGAVVLEDGKGGAHPVDSRALRQILSGRGLSLVFLNACESGRAGRTDFQRGVAPALVAAGLPAVVANQYAVLDEAATAFARLFYGALAAGASLGAAAREARIALHYAAPDSIDWAVPVLFARDPSARLR